jgi:putative chitinase
MSISLVNEICPSVPLSRLAPYAPFFDVSLTRWGITLPQSVGAFIANVAVESANFKSTLEYASGEEYEGRKDLGNVILGDGVKFKGRGLIQITGRTAYQQCSRALFGNDCLLQAPSMLEAPANAINSACWFVTNFKPDWIATTRLPETWIHPGTHGYTKFQWLVILINGGLNDYDARLANYQRARQILNF